MTSLEPWMDYEQWKQLKSQCSLSNLLLPSLGTVVLILQSLDKRQQAFLNLGSKCHMEQRSPNNFFLHVLPEQEIRLLHTNALSVDFHYFSKILFILM